MIRGWELILEKQEELGSQKVVKLKLRGDRELAGPWLWSRRVDGR